ncbi:hypothetical protein PISMIDRAFT_94121 [Pisolithus microcarpus 441]|uniref:Unplaced genomic scaffold scaffold_15, whole genome shotgun sequence n=1 Tax=Pisolithus microcarpus 441 TaxID=765257 RepID=A0A0C9ZXL8_9AGAM|nr:hypothetical protein BKA83DRAFT_94121 [Pisolithus microcarpus]KIK26922.1 hypothetical protein PISMIDRAFT_94121 [Pisolithus microcarpus 441]
MSSLLTTLHPRVMGPLGSGKTNFINRLTGAKEERAARQHKPYTRSVKGFAVNVSKDRQYMFVDTPGFNDTYPTDRDVLRTIAEWLEKNYRGEINLSGIIYTHRATDNQMSGSVCRNLDMFARLCGDRGAAGVRLVTTMWGMVKNTELAEKRASQLENWFWRPLIDAGARHRRFEENSSRCAWRIIEDLTARVAENDYVIL